MSFIVNYISKYTQERVLLKILIILSTVCCVLLIPLNFLYEIHFAQFFILFAILFICSNILESVDSSLLAKIMPPNSSRDLSHFFNPGLAIIVTTTGGRFVGSLLVSVFGIF